MHSSVVSFVSLSVFWSEAGSRFVSRFSFASFLFCFLFFISFFFLGSGVWRFFVAATHILEIFTGSCFTSSRIVFDYQSYCDRASSCVSSSFEQKQILWQSYSILQPKRDQISPLLPVSVSGKKSACSPLCVCVCWKLGFLNSFGVILRWGKKQSQGSLGLKAVFF